jgi:hypothetical protein
LPITPEDLTEGLPIAQNTPGKKLGEALINEGKAGFPGIKETGGTGIAEVLSDKIAKIVEKLG